MAVNIRLTPRPLTAVTYYSILQHLVKHQIHIPVDCSAISTHKKFKNAQVPVGQCLTNQFSQKQTSILKVLFYQGYNIQNDQQKNMCFVSMKWQHP